MRTRTPSSDHTSSMARGDAPWRRCRAGPRAGPGRRRRRCAGLAGHLGRQLGHALGELRAVATRTRPTTATSRSGEARPPAPPSQQQPGRRGARVLMPGAALAQVAGAALAGHQRDRSPSCPARAASAAAAEPRPAATLRRRRPRAAPPPPAAARRPSSCPPSSALPRACTPAHTGARARPPTRPSVSSDAWRGRRPHLEEERAVQRPGRAADGRHQRHAHDLQQGADAAARRRRRPSQLADHRLHAAVHVDAVVGVADGRVQLGQVRRVSRHRGREGPQPGDHTALCA